MTDAHNNSVLSPGHRVMLHRHAWRVVAVIDPGERVGAVAESAGAYAAVPPRTAGPEDTPWCVVVGGPNGAGKTTFALEYLPRYADCHEFINPDLIICLILVWVPDIDLCAAREAGEVIMAPGFLDRIRLETGL